jgi:FMN phosphatase YigB (HAD superfamily)
MSTKILFLDIDGVLCTSRSHLAYGKEGGIWHEWDPLAANAIRRACQQGVGLVISSTWRFHEKDLWPQMDKHLLNEFVVRPDWRTKDMRCDGHQRGDEIAEWLSRHPEVGDYRILDDDNDMLEDQLKKCIFTDALDGMTHENIKKLLNWAGALRA